MNETSPENQPSQLPKRWILTTLGEVISPTIEQGSPKHTSEFLYIDISSIDNKTKKIIEPKLLTTNQAPSRAKQHLKPFDVLVSMTRPNLNAVSIVPIEYENAIGSTGFCVLRTIEIFPKLIFYLVQSETFISAMSLLVQGALYPAVRPKDIYSYKIHLPPLAEQERIVLKIEELFTKLEVGVLELKHAQAQLKRYRQSVLKQAFEGKLTNVNLNEDELPESWEWIKIGDICKTIDGDRGTNYPKKNEFSSDGYCLFLSTKNVRNGRFVFEENIFITKEKDDILRGGKLELNDVVITTRGTLGNVALYDEKIPFKHIRINSGMLILRITNKLLNNAYLMKFITSPVFISQLKSKQTGTAQPQIPANILKEIEIPFGSIEEQARIVEEVERLLSVADEVEKTIDESLKQAERLRQSILQKAFTGKLVEQNEIDEPASVLLERIKLEREGQTETKKVKSETKIKVKKPKTKQGTQGDLPF